VPFLSISLYNFRNIENQTIDLSAPEIFLVGQNGQGKTNFLESLYIASYGNSFRTRNDSEIYRIGTTEYSVRAFFKESEEKSHNLSIISKNKKKIFEKNFKKILDRKEIISTIPCVLFCHDDLNFIIGPPERRRFFIDQSLSLYDNSYISILRNFSKLLKSRNLVLKEKNNKVLDVIDTQLIPLGITIMEKRRELIKSFNVIFSELYERISGINSVYIDYCSSWKGSSFDKILIELIEKRNFDFVMNTSMSGPHRDKIRFMRDKKIFTPTASTGQRRLLSLILRLAQAYVYNQVTHKLPVLLLDDVLLELDSEKKKKFIDNLPPYDQIIYTFLPGEPYTDYQHKKTLIYIVSEGTFRVE